MNDKRGNPVDIAAVVVWRVEDTAKAVFDVDDFETYVATQSETAVRHLASAYPYDSGETFADTEDEITLRGNVDEVSEALRVELTERLEQAGVTVEQARLTHLAYAPEIAQAMLRRQQAEAVIAARRKIVMGATSMVEMALNDLSEKHVVEFDEERKAAMISNLMVVLCGESQVTPVVNTGTLYHVMRPWTREDGGATAPGGLSGTAGLRASWQGWVLTGAYVAVVFVLATTLAESQPAVFWTLLRAGDGRLPRRRLPDARETRAEAEADCRRTARDDGRSANSTCCASTPSSGARSRSGPPTSSAASTRRWSTSCATRCAGAAAAGPPGTPPQAAGPPAAAREAGPASCAARAGRARLPNRHTVVPVLHSDDAPQATTAGGASLR